MALRLEVAEFTDANHWRWRLTDADGAFLADHAVALDPADQKYQALFDLPGYLRHFSAPDKRDEDERRLLQEVGKWIGETVLGQDIGEKIVTSGFPPIVVRVVVPEQAESVAQQLAAAGAGCASPPFEITVVTEDGCHLVLEVNARLLEEDGKPLVVEKMIGRGKALLLANGSFLLNEALVNPARRVD